MTARDEALRPGFRSEPVTRRAGKGLVELLEPLEYVSRRGFRVLIPPGFHSDGASVPAWLWGLLRCGWVELLPFGLLHDLLYRRDGHILIAGQALAVPDRGWADAAGCEALATLGRKQARDAKVVRPGLWLGARSSWHRRQMGWRG